MDAGRVGAGDGASASGHRVVATRMIGMAAREAARGEPRPLARTMAFDRFPRIIGAAWIEAAVRPEQRAARRTGTRATAQAAAISSRRGAALGGQQPVEQPARLGGDPASSSAGGTGLAQSDDQVERVHRRPAAADGLAQHALEAVTVDGAPEELLADRRSRPGRWPQWSAWRAVAAGPLRSGDRRGTPRQKPRCRGDDGGGSSRRGVPKLVRRPAGRDLWRGAHAGPCGRRRTSSGRGTHGSACAGLPRAGKCVSLLCLAGKKALY